MGRSSVVRIVALIASSIAFVGSSALGAAASHAAPGSVTKPGGVVEITFDPTVVSAMFKVGVFMYGSSEVSVYASDSGSLSADYPLSGAWRARATSLIAIDPESGGLTLRNGPAEVYAGLGSIVVRRTGATGVIDARISGMFSIESGQFEKKMTAFRVTRAKATRTARGWMMDGILTLTPEAASTMNTLLKTTVFSSGAPIGTVSAVVGPDERS